MPYIFSVNKNLIDEAKAVYCYKQIHSYKNSYLINEAPTNIADYGNNILDFIYSNNNNMILNKLDFLKFIPISWQY